MKTCYEMHENNAAVGEQSPTGLSSTYAEVEMEHKRASEYLRCWKKRDRS